MSSEDILPASGQSSRTASTRAFDSSDSSVNRVDLCDRPFERSQQSDGTFEHSQKYDEQFEHTTQYDRSFEQSDREFYDGQCDKKFERSQQSDETLDHKCDEQFEHASDRQFDGQYDRKFNNIPERSLEYNPVDKSEKTFEHCQQSDREFANNEQFKRPFENQRCDAPFEHTDQCNRNVEYGQHCNRLLERNDKSISVLERKGRNENKDKEAGVDALCSSKRRICCGNMGQCVWGVVFIILSISGFIVTPLDIMLWEKLNMRPGLPPYEWWADPPDEVKLRMYVFNVTNHERFLAGLDTKLNMVEIGPIVYLEKLIHTNIVFNPNSTMTYTATRVPIYLPHENTINLNDTIIVPNMAVLGLQSYLHSAPFFVKSAFNLLVRSQHSPLFVERTIYEYLWDYTDPVLDVSKNLAPGLVPVSNMGMLARVYGDFEDQVTVKIGHRWGHRQFFQIDRFRGRPQIPGYDPNTCPDRIFGSTEGVMYQQRLTKQDVLLYWRKTVCKLMPLFFDSELTESNMLLYRYNLSDSVFERTNGSDCYDTVPSLPPGVSDASKCYYDFPMVVTFPHFFTGRVAKDQFVTGMKPDRAKHNSYVIVEPQSGIPFYSVARMQSNLRVHDLSGFGGEYRKFSNSIVPLFWAEYNQEGLPPRIRWTIYFMSTVLPPLSNILLSMTLLIGLYFITKYIIHVTKIRNDTLKAIILLRTKNVNSLAKNKIFSYEKEAFLKRPQ